MCDCKNMDSVSIWNILKIWAFKNWKTRLFCFPLDPRVQSTPPAFDLFRDIHVLALPVLSSFCFLLYQSALWPLTSSAGFSTCLLSVGPAQCQTVFVYLCREVIGALCPDVALCHTVRFLLPSMILVKGQNVGFVSPRPPLGSSTYLINDIY